MQHREQISKKKVSTLTFFGPWANHVTYIVHIKTEMIMAVIHAQVVALCTLLRWNKWSLGADRMPELIHGFCGMKRLGVSLLLPDGMLVHRRSFFCNLFGNPNNLPAPIYTPGWRVTRRVKCLVQEHDRVSQPGLEPGPLTPGTSVLTMRTPSLPKAAMIIHVFISFSSVQTQKLIFTKIT